VLNKVWYCNISTDVYLCSWIRRHGILQYRYSCSFQVCLCS